MLFDEASVMTSLTNATAKNRIKWEKLNTNSNSDIYKGNIYEDIYM